MTEALTQNALQPLHKPAQGRATLASLKALVQQHGVRAQAAQLS